MGKKSVDTQAPPPKAQDLIAAQQQANTQNIVDLIGANRIDTQTPFGSINFTGGSGPGGVFGQTQNVTLAPGIQQTVDNQQDLAAALSGLGVDAASGINLAPPDLSGLGARVDTIDTSGLPALPGIDDFSGARDQASQAFFDRGSALLQPRFDLQNRRTEQTLADRGFNLPGSAGETAAPAAQAELNRVGDLQNRAFGDLANSAQIFGGAEQSRLFNDALNARGQGFGQQLAGSAFANDARNQGLAEILGLRNLPFQDIGQLNSLTPNLPLIQPGGFFQPNQAAPDAIGAGLGAFDLDLKKAIADQKAKAGFFSDLTSLIGGAGSFFLPAAFPGTFGTE